MLTLTIFIKSLLDKLLTQLILKMYQSPQPKMSFSALSSIKTTDHSVEAINKQKAEDEIIANRCREIFWKIHPQLIHNYYGWFIYIEPKSGDYFLDSDRNAARQQARTKYPAARLMAMCINETGAVGKI